MVPGRAPAGGIDTVPRTLSGGGTLVLNGATLSFAVLCEAIVLGIGGSMPHD